MVYHCEEFVLDCFFDVLFSFSKFIETLLTDSVFTITAILCLSSKSMAGPRVSQSTGHSRWKQWWR